MNELVAQEVDFSDKTKDIDDLSQYKTAYSMKYLLNTLELTYCEKYLENFNLEDAMRALHPYTTNKVLDEAIKIQSSPVVQRYLYLRRKELIGNFLNPNDLILASKHLFSVAIREEKSQATALKALELIAKISGLLNNETTDNGQNVAVQNVNVGKKDMKEFKKLLDGIL
jgi:hypothetical protein